MRLPSCSVNGTFKRYVLAIGIVFALEIWFHLSRLSTENFQIEINKAPRPDCHAPEHLLEHNSTTSRQNATVLMLARNEDLEEAVDDLKSFESQFNHRYHYPVVFLNNEPWTDAFIHNVSGLVSGQAIFDIISPDMWGFQSRP